VKIGITGGAGFIGGHVVEEALTRGHSVVIFDRRGALPSAGLGINPGATIERFLGDILDPIAVTELAAHVDGIIHLAACLGTQETITNPRPSATTNVQGGLNALEAATEHDIPLTYIGVGNHWMNNSYSISKTTIERYIQMYVKERGTKANVVRAVNAYGPRQSVAPPFGPAKVRKITPAFVCRALTGMPIEVYGNGSQISDMVYVKDVARALVSALEHAQEGSAVGETIEVGPDRSHSLTVTSLGGPIQPEIVHLPMRPGEEPGAVVSADPETLRIIGIDPATLVPFEQGIRTTVKWFIENWLDGFTGFDDEDETEDTAVSAAV
jgi:UDP-glucose 4-epimerase